MSASTSIIPGSSQANDSAGQIEKNDMSTGSDTALNRKGKGRQINLDTATRNVEPASPVSPGKHDTHMPKSLLPTESSLPNLATGPISPVSPVERVEPKNFAGLQPEQAIGTANPEQATPASSAQSDTDGHSQPISIVKPNLVNPNKLGNRPAEAGFEELISQTDKNILEICTIQGVSYDFSLQTLLPKILHEFSTFVSDPIIENIATRVNPVSNDNWVRCQQRIAGTRELISTLRAPPNFADTMFFPNLLTRDVNEAQDTESYNDAENKALTQTLEMEYFNSIGGLNGILKKFLDGGSDSNQRSALRKLDENAKFFGEKCSDSYGIKPEQNSFILKEEDIKEYENMRRSVDRAREAVLKNPHDERLKLKAAGKSTVFKPLVVNDGILSNQKSNSRFIMSIVWKSFFGTIIDNGIEKKIVGFRSVGNGEQLLLEWCNEGAMRDAFELVASSVYKGKRKEYNGGKMEVGTKSELKSYSLRDCGFGGVAQYIA
ncbi:hypothetical protein BOTCAL_0551g00040 [Botryotinia calthae]|uniref:Uncharacterized protein n=1 Tax=Botryotinia calthae TaxID=38488 RepID=A0A4Y8CMP3_9HELO|nr:hypothetical protein BOTCAL_0551g00040 [Botryotinia calthae]